MSRSTYHFRPEPVLDGEAVAVVAMISGTDPMAAGRQVYLIEVLPDGASRAYEIRCEVWNSAFQEALRIGDLLAVGYGDHFYLYDLLTRTNLLSLQNEGYFGNIHLDGSLLYVAGCHHLHCIGLDGRIIWRTEVLGMDGVIVESFGVDRIHGAGEWDPPGGWRPFTLDKETGRRVDRDRPSS